MTEPTSGHIVQSFDEDLRRLKSVLLEMGELATSQVRDATRALLERDDKLASLVLEREKELNAFDTRGEEAAIQLLAKRQPMGEDLRTVIVTLKGLGELERVGNESRKIARIARRMIVDEIDVVDAYRNSFERMVKAADEALAGALRALRDHDKELAITVAEADKLLDLEYKNALRAIHEGVMAKPVLLPVAAEAVLIIKAIERIGDHAKNIAKNVLYLVEGKDVRHVKSRLLAEVLSKSDESAEQT